MTERDIRNAILQVCKIPSWDSDFNVVAFHAMCDKLKAIGATEEREACAEHYLGIMRGAIAEEREACAKVADKYSEGQERNYSENIADEIRARGNT